MKNNKVFLLIFLIFLVRISFAQNVVINELDCDTPGIDNKEFVELRSLQPNFPLDGYSLVFFNGSANGGNSAYLALDLDGYKTDINGIFLIGSVTVIPFPQYLIPENTIQNGADAVAIYRNDAVNFPEGTIAYADSSLEDVLIYGTSDPDAVSLLDIFKLFNPAIKQINEGSTNNTNSIQRQADGTYIAGAPNPRKPNDGSGIILTGLRTSFDKTIYTEGETFDLIFTTESPVNQNLTFSFTLKNGGFNNADFIGNTNVTILQGSNTATSKITFVDDSSDEGDEELLFSLDTLPAEYLVLNNNVKIRIVDNDFKVADFGTPIHSTYGKIKGTQSPTYYQSLNGKIGTSLKPALQAIIADPAVVRAQTYNDVINILMEADQNPENSNQVWLVYSEKGRAKLDLQTSSNNVNVWNREHTWPRSRGGFDSIEADETYDGKNIFWVTGPDSLRHANSDAHAIRPEDGPENSIRGNQFYGQYSGPAGTLGGFKGDVARSIFYLAVRYNGLEVVSGYPDGMIGKFGDLDTLLTWHRNDPPDDFEMNRNNVVQTWQFNRNPFIDMPEMIEYIWGDKQDEIWQNPSSVTWTDIDNFQIFPNPTSSTLQINLGTIMDGKFTLSDVNGAILQSKSFVAQNLISTNVEGLKGIYFITILPTIGQAVTKKLVIGN
ncbi:MAG: endonuclease [Saprospiraceae bacterium]|nr:endonuclease [Saprospiraceae bacterium]MBP6539181.1 endonuclease [Saprospiraceae bacterium]